MKTCLVELVLWSKASRLWSEIMREVMPVFFPSAYVNPQRKMTLRTASYILDFGYPVSTLWFYCSQNFKLFVFPICRFWVSPDEGYSRNASCALNLISTVVFFYIIIHNISNLRDTEVEICIIIRSMKENRCQIIKIR
jgi:hypothetical protein